MAKITNNIMHLALRVKNYEKSLHFYHDVLGFDIMFELKKKDLYETLNPNDKTIKGDENEMWLAYLRVKNEQYLEIFPVPKEEVIQDHDRQSFFHMSMQVDNIVESVRELRKRGVVVYNLHIDVLNNNPPPEKFVPVRGRCGSLIAWLQDPDGNLIEMMELTSQSLQKKCDALLSAKE